jgi:hypothetical protein
MIDDTAATGAMVVRRNRTTLSILCWPATKLTFLVHFIVMKKLGAEFPTTDHE